jgi:NAD(P)-dependent dehydrogenase (short-subunit alcohol dehydrogenase family)
MSRGSRFIHVHPSINLVHRFSFFLIVTAPPSPSPSQHQQPFLSTMDMSTDESPQPQVADATMESTTSTTAENSSTEGANNDGKKQESKPVLDDPSSEPSIPQLEGITQDDLTKAIQVLNAVAALNPKKRKKDDPDGMELYKHANLRPLRKALASCLEVHQRIMYQGKDEQDHFDQRLQERSLKRQKTAERDRQKMYLATTTLRSGRIARLAGKQQEAKEEEMSKVQFMIPDGHVETTTTTDAATTTPKLLKNGNDDDDEEDTIKLPNLRSCYVCKVRYRDLHKFYDQLCPSCAALNWEKRHQLANLDGRVAVVTGSRVKIGYQTCLKLLRSGATVVATTRFPNSAAATYRQESDFNTWKDRLQVYGLDLRDVTGMEAFTRFLKMKYSKGGLDILINNACQTVRRPRAYYVPITDREQSLWKEADETHKSLLGGCAEFERLRRKLLLVEKSGKTVEQLENGHADGGMGLLVNGPSETEHKPTTDAMVATAKEEETTTTPFDTTGVSHSAAMSQMVILPEDVGVDDDVLPPGVTDINDQQLDLRKTNSWLLKMEEVSTPEVMECMFINAIAPFVLNSRLKPLMTIPNDREDRYIINVSAMEGKFYRYKMANHPHTNMAKAALNMMTRTSSEDLAKKHRIFMNSVDTGWINDENPLEKANKTANVNNFQTPIDEIDAAARILDPIFSGVNGDADMKKDYGKFLKDYRETEW